MNGIEHLEAKNGCVLVHNMDCNMAVLLDSKTCAPLASISKDDYNGEIIRTSGSSGSMIFNHGEGWTL